MFTDSAQAVIDQAKDYAFSSGAGELTLNALLAALGNSPEARVLCAECLAAEPDSFQECCPRQPDPASCPGKLPLASSVRLVLETAKTLAEEVPDRSHPGLIDLRHIACAVSVSREACSMLGLSPASRDDCVTLLASWYEKQSTAPRLDDLTERVRQMRSELLSKVFGQDHAVHAFVEGVFNSEVVATADVNRKAPRAVFVFAGPPGVGKTYLAELAASSLGRPFKRFDMSAYSGHQQNEALVGMAKSFSGAHPGTLTEFVEKNPNAVLLFDEIEKAHIKTIHLFLQILDAGILEDKFHERNVPFRDTTIIFTTNAGRKLYDRPNASGVHTANAAFHRQTVLDALENEKDPETRQAVFPAAICSRLATGYPVLFNHLRVNELERVVWTELHRVGTLLERQYYKRTSFEELIPMCLVLREGGRADARTLRSQAETFVKTEIFNFCQLFETDRLDDALKDVERLAFHLEQDGDGLPAEIRTLFEPDSLPHVLLVADSELADLYRDSLQKVKIHTAGSAQDALRILADEEIDMVLLDLWLGRSADLQALTMTARYFDHVPVAARGLDRGQEALRSIRERLPKMPVYLLSLAQSEAGTETGSVDEELFMACVRAGGARGLLVSHFVDGMEPGWERQRDRLDSSLMGICRRLHREKAADRLAQERKVLSFDTVPRIERQEKAITFRMRNLRLGRAIAAADAGEVLEDIERPRTRFDDVVGATAAKEELHFFIDYMKNPRRFAALGLKPPKGVLLYGPPGTGKTMIARAMAGESNVAFIPASAANFVTIWQGSGPQSIRDLFDRARRYAPAIVFIDEIDAIGKERTGSAGGGRSEENTLNALLTEMDGFSSPSPDRPVFILAATNFKVKSEEGEPPEERKERKLDEALVRRFSRTIKVELPERPAREEYLKKRLGGLRNCTVSSSSIASIAERAIGMSIADLEAVVEAAGREAIRRDGELSSEILDYAFETAVHGEARTKGRADLQRTAIHEAGHAVMYWLSGWWPSYVTVVSRGGHGGYMRHCAEEVERKGSATHEESLAGIRTGLGGRGAEIVCYGSPAGLSTGAAGDLSSASEDARRMVAEYGMDEEYGIRSNREYLRYYETRNCPGFWKVEEVVDRILKEQMSATVALLNEHREHLDAVAAALVAEERLSSDRLREILPESPKARKTNEKTRAADSAHNPQPEDGSRN